MADGSLAASLTVDGDVLRLRGTLGMGTVTALLDPGRAAIRAAHGAPLTLDFTEVGKSDSAGLALVVDWLRAARASGGDLVLRNVPHQLADIARVSGLADLIGEEAGDAA